MTSAFDDPSAVAASLQGGDRRALARALTWVENRTPEGDALLAALPEAPPLRIGITGPPGAGKSTLVSAMTAVWRAQDRAIGVLAVDPTSPVTGGALLGDRVRMQKHAGDEQVFVRSLATRGAAGGLSRAIESAARVLGAAGFSPVVIETVGVGQTEVDVAHVADITVLVMAPGAGDGVQGLKAGPLELADVIVVNQADRDGADALAAALVASLELADRVAPPVLRTVATRAEGVVELVAWLDNHDTAGPRSAAHVRLRLRGALERALLDRYWRRGTEAFEAAVDAVRENRQTLEQAVADLLASSEDPA